MTPRLVHRTTALLAGLAVLPALMFVPGGADEPAAAAGSSDAQQAGEAPEVIPSLERWSGTDGALELTADSRVLVHPGAQRVRQDARRFAAELRAQTGLRLPVLPTLRPARDGDILLEVDPTRDDLGAEGYDLEVGDAVHITAATASGAFYGTRTILQMLATGDTLPRGNTVDVPDYGERGVGVCACYIHVSVEWFERLMKDMAYLKLNHLWIEAKVKSDRSPETAFWGYYTKDEIREISALAARYHITLVPEINSPGHFDTYLENRPDLQLVDKFGERQPSRLDITKDESFEFLTGLIDEALTVWDTPYWHMGADEYMLGSEYENFPQIVEYAQDKFGPQATPQDAFIDFINRINDHVKSEGKTLRIWNDGLTGQNIVELDSDIVVEHWLGGDDILPPSRLLEQGHRVMNSAYALYLVRGGFVTDTKALYDSGWTPLEFYDETLPSAHRNVTGAKITMWPDNGRGNTENEVEEQAFMPMRHLALKTWGGPKPTETYAEFEALAEEIGRAPGWDDTDRQPLPAETFALIDSATGERLTPTALEADARTSFSAASSSTWDLLPTDDSYYRLRSTGTELCLDITTGRQYLNVPLEAGAPFTLTPCSTDASDKTQRWQFGTVGEGRYRLVNAITQLPLARNDEDVAVQMPPDQQEPVVFGAR